MNNITINNFGWDNWMTFELKCEVVQVVAVPTPIGLKMTPGAGNEIVVTQITTGNDDYAASRTISVQVIDSAASFVNDLMKASIDNKRLLGPGLGELGSTIIANTPEHLGAKSLPMFISGTDSLQFKGDSLADGEKITIKVRYKARNKIALLSKVAATATLTVTKHEVVA